MKFAGDTFLCDASVARIAKVKAIAKQYKLRNQNKSILVGVGAEVYTKKDFTAVINYNAYCNADCRRAIDKAFGPTMRSELIYHLGLP